MSFLHAIAFVRSFIDPQVADAKERGATAVEYGLLVALIAAIIVGVVAALGTKILNAFTIVRDALP